MRHRVAGRHLGRDTAHRRSLYRNLVTDLLRYERITTTEAKAKEIRPMAEKIITLGKRGDLHARRQALRFVYDRTVVDKLFGDIADRIDIWIRGSQRRIHDDSSVDIESSIFRESKIRSRPCGDNDHVAFDSPTILQLHTGHCLIT
ncbi:50S ribosomal protein L17 [Candidatus Bipolaricaulota bacterium]|nr:50S ribosomal protein L17 [Candidatus Bipolaricaulota bacterium]